MTSSFKFLSKRSKQKLKKRQRQVELQQQQLNNGKNGSNIGSNDGDDGCDDGEVDANNNQVSKLINTNKRTTVESSMTRLMKRKRRVGFGDNRIVSLRSILNTWQAPKSVEKIINMFWKPLPTRLMIGWMATVGLFQISRAILDRLLIRDDDSYLHYE